MLMFFCNPAWPQYKLEGEEIWPENGTLNYNTIVQLDLVYKRQGKWTEIPYIQALMALYQTLTHITLGDPRTYLFSPSTLQSTINSAASGPSSSVLCHHTYVLSSFLCGLPLSLL